MAEISGDETMLKLCMPGEDPHAFMGAQVNGPDYQAMLAALAADNVDPAISNTRQLGKVANLSLQYRTGAARLREVARVQYGIDMTEQLSRVVHKKYQLSYPGVPRYWSRQKGLVTDQGYAETLAGRRVCVTLPERWSQTFGGVKIEDKRWRYESTAVNFPIQGTGADQKYLALAVLRNELAKFDAHYYFELHDGLFIIAPNAKAEAAAHHIRSVLDALPYKQAWGFTPRIPLPFDAKIGPSWGQLKKVH
jgi:DNA polymerase I-like protein with 3'-5' exonuclease and polymerase domains